MTLCVGECLTEVDWVLGLQKKERSIMKKLMFAVAAIAAGAAFADVTSANIVG